MKKFFIMVTLLVFAVSTSNAQNVITKKQVVGTGGFVAKTATVNSEQVKMSGIFGQAITGKLAPTINGGTSNMYIGFWAASDPFSSVDEGLQASNARIYNYPNPAMSYTTFRFNLTEAASVSLNVYNSLGALVANVAQDAMVNAGENSINWNINNVNIASGTYTYELAVNPLAASSASRAFSLRGMLIISK